MSQRTRSTYGQSPTPSVYSVHTNVNNSKVYYPYSSQIGGYTGTNKSITDESHRNFEQMKARGQVVLGDLYLTWRSREWSDQSFTFGPHPTWGSETITGDLASWIEGRVSDPLPSMSADLDQMRAIALAKAYAKMNQPVVLSGEILRDLDTSLAMLRRPFKESRTILNKMLKYRKRHLGKTVESAARASGNAWLEYRYGWQPVMMDADAIINNVHRVREKLDSKRLVARAGEKQSRSASASFTVSGGIPRLDSISGTVSSTKNGRVGAGVLYDIKNRTTSEDLGSMFGTRPSDLPTTIWEAIPYSFVADWFINVGDWLQATTPNPNVIVRGNWTTAIFEWSLSLTNCQASVRIASAPTTTYTGVISGSVKTGCDVDRRCNQSLTSHPVLTVKSLSPLRSIDALSLSLSNIFGMLKSLRH